MSSHLLLWLLLIQLSLNNFFSCNKTDIHTPVSHHNKTHWLINLNFNTIFVLLLWSLTLSYPLCLKSTHIYQTYCGPFRDVCCLNLSLLCIILFSPGVFFFFFKCWAGAARTNAMALPVGFTLSKMEEVCSPPLQAMFTIPTPGPKQVYVTIKQLVACYSLTLFKGSVAGPPETARAICAVTTNQEAVS